MAAHRRELTMVWRDASHAIAMTADPSCLVLDLILMHQLCKAFVHGRGVLHCDLKLHNLLMDCRTMSLKKVLVIKRGRGWVNKDDMHCLFRDAEQVNGVEIHGFKYQICHCLVSVLVPAVLPEQEDDPHAYYILGGIRHYNCTFVEYMLHSALHCPLKEMC